MNELRNVLAQEFTDPEYAHAYLEENSNMRIAAQVRALRLHDGLSQRELADLACMKQERISKIEAADFDSLTLKTLRRLAQAFDVHLSVKFEGVHDAVVDFIELSNERLLCEKRAESIKKLAAQPAPANVYSSAGAIITIPVAGTAVRRAIPAQVGVKIEA